MFYRFYRICSTTVQQDFIDDILYNFRDFRLSLWIKWSKTLMNLVQVGLKERGVRGRPFGGDDINAMNWFINIWQNEADFHRTLCEIDATLQGIQKSLIKGIIPCRSDCLAGGHNSGLRLNLNSSLSVQGTIRWGTRYSRRAWREKDISDSSKLVRAIHKQKPKRSTPVFQCDRTFQHAKEKVSLFRPAPQHTWSIY